MSEDDQADVGVTVSQFGICANPLSAAREQTVPVRNQQGTDRAAAETALLWENGSTVRVIFLNGGSAFKDAVRTIAPEWTDHANLTFDFSAKRARGKKPDITVNFDPINGHYGIYNSWVGAASRGRSPSMNLIFPPGVTDGAALRRYILHEFGHALGLIHEHQSPGRRFKWNEREVIEWFRQNVGWDEKTVRQQVLDPSVTKTMTNTQFDKKSVMLYPIYPGWASNRLTTDWNHNLSTTDKKFAAKLYPP